MSLLKVENLSKNFIIKGQSLRAVDSVSFDIEPGTTLGLAGESGCGKSTLAKMLVNLVKPSSGRILFKGQEITTLNSKGWKPLRRQIQMIFQHSSTSLNPRMTIEQIVGEALEIHFIMNKEQRNKRIQELLDLVEIPLSFKERFPTELSGGQKQRVGIARALSVEPSLIICDEPLSSLDATIQTHILQLLQRLQRDLGLTYLFISHDLSVMRSFAQRIAIMYLGKIVEIGEAQDLYHHPLHPYSKALLSAIPIPNPKQERQRNRIILLGDPPSPFNPPSGCPFHTRCPLARPQCKEIVPTLEEIKPHRLVACNIVDKM